MSICGCNFSFFSTFGWSFESCLSSNGIDFPVSRPNFLGVNLNTYYNNPTTFSFTTTNYLDCLQKCKLNHQDLSLINADECALKLDPNATQKIQRIIQRLEDYLDQDLVIPSSSLHLFTSQFPLHLSIRAHKLCNIMFDTILFPTAFYVV
jgi:hypothetical protein